LLSPMRSLPRYSYFADCKLYIRTRLLASAFSNFLNLLNYLTFCEDATARLRRTSVSYCSTFEKYYIVSYILCCQHQVSRN
ncbi:hypothetical protein DFS33DRAFT_1268385, partial [Desarmillaria ectypa]